MVGKAAGEPHKTGDYALRTAPCRPAGAVVALLGCALGCALVTTPLAAQDATPTAVTEGEVFKVLKLEGHQVRWPLPVGGGPRVLTYRLVTETQTFPAARNCRGLTALDGLAAASHLPATAVTEEAAAAFAMWETAANVIFKEAPEGGPADILIGAQTEPDGWAFADVFYETSSPEAIKPISKALVCLNPTRSWKVGFNGDLKSYDVRYTLAHEIGHAIGLDHPAGSNAIMGYRYEERFRALQPGDMRGAALLYGTPPASGLLVAGSTPRGEATAALAGQTPSSAGAAPVPADGRALGTSPGQHE
jgi:matrixin